MFPETIHSIESPFIPLGLHLNIAEKLKKKYENCFNIERIRMEF